MKDRGVWVSVLGIWLAGLGLIVPARVLFAQRGAEMAGLAFLGAFLMFFLVIFGAIYVYMALALATIARKTNTANAWLAWIPIANIVLMLNIGQKPVWWIVLFLVPFVNIVIMVLVWMAIAKARGRPDWWGLLIIAPIANFILPGILAWTD